jgi:hypothetical protein
MTSNTEAAWAPDGPEQVRTKGLKFSIVIGSETTPLDVIRGVTATLPRVDQLLRESVAKARAQGRSWQEIAEALGVSRQSAWERFKQVDEEREREDVISRVLGSLKGPGPTTDEMRRVAREEEAEIEERGKTP